MSSGLSRKGAFWSRGIWKELLSFWMSLRPPGLLWQRKKNVRHRVGVGHKGQWCDWAAKPCPVGEGWCVGTCAQLFSRTPPGRRNDFCVLSRASQPCLIMTQQIRGGKGRGGRDGHRI